MERAGRLYITCDEATTCTRQVLKRHLCPDPNIIPSLVSESVFALCLPGLISHRADLRSKMRSGLYINGCLIATAFASPLLVDIEPRIKDSNSDSSHSIFRAEPRVPWGPKEFICEPYNLGRNRLDPRSVYGLALLTATTLAIGDFEGELPNNPATFVNVAFPHIAATVFRPNPNLPVARKYVHWGLARVINHIIQDRDFKDNTYFLFWTDPNRVRRKVAEFYIGPMPPTLGVGSDSSQTASLLSQALNGTETILAPGLQHANDTQVSIDSSSNDVTYEYEFHDEEMTIEDVVMGTLGAMNQAAEDYDRSKDVDTFAGIFPHYKAVIVWSGRSGLTYSLLIQSMRKAAVTAMTANNFHELRVIMIRNGAELARGGWIRIPDPDVATS